MLIDNPTGQAPSLSQRCAPDGRARRKRGQAPFRTCGCARDGRARTAAKKVPDTFFALALAVVLALPACAAPNLADNATWQLTAPGLPAVTGSLFLWHDDYKYEVPQEVRREGQAVTGWLTGSNDGAKVSFRVASRVEGEQLVLDYVFRRDAGTKLNRGMLMLVALPLEPLAKRAIRFSHGLPALAGSGWDGVGESLSVNLSDQQAFVLTADRLVSFERRPDAKTSIVINTRLLPADFPAEQDVPVSIKLGLGAAGSDALPWDHHDQRPLRIGGAKAAAGTVAVNGTATIDVDLQGSYQNPFDPEQIALDADITFPDGRVRRLPGYYHRDFTAELVDGAELLVPQGEPGWRVRFTPTQAGAYSVALTATQAGQRVAGPTVKLTAGGPTEPGLIRLPAKGDRFVRDTGETLFLIGHNIPTYLTGPESMADALDTMQANGENFNRFWMYSSHLGLEWGQPAGTYRLEEAWRLDNAFELARQRGINILLCMDTHQDYRDKLEMNPYHTSQGGPITTAMDFFSDPAAHQLYRQRLRYLVARWSHCTNLVAWEFANEIEGWAGYSENQEMVAGWHTAMARVLRDLDPYDHPITTSCWTTVGWPTLWNAPGIDFVQSHHYSNSKVDMAQRTIDICRQKRTDYPGRLHLFGEMGINSRFRADFGDDEDPTGVHLHNQNWAALFEGAASVPANWWHESYFRKHNLYPRFAGLAKFVAAIDLGRAWQPTGDLTLEWVTPPAQPRREDLGFGGRGENWRKSDTAPIVTPHADGSVEGTGQLPTLLHGNAHRDVRVPWTFRLSFDQPSVLELQIATASNNPLLVATLDGQEVLRRDFPTAEGLGKSSVYRDQWKIWETVYDEVVTIPIPAGSHELVLSNEGGDWLTIASFRLPEFVVRRRPPLQSIGLRDGAHFMAWVRNTGYWWLPVSQGKSIEPVPPSRLMLPDLPAGRYTLELWDTAQGVVTSTSEVTLPQAQGLPLPVIAWDLALRLEPLN